LAPQVLAGGTSNMRPNTLQEVTPGGQVLATQFTRHFAPSPMDLLSLWCGRTAYLGQLDGLPATQTPTTPEKAHPLKAKLQLTLQDRPAPPRLGKRRTLTRLTIHTNNFCNPKCFETSRPTLLALSHQAGGPNQAKKAHPAASPNGGSMRNNFTEYSGNPKE
jgi:hypothetical protein